MGFRGKLLRKDLGEITGVTQEKDGNTAEVTFSWRWSPTDFCKELMAAGADCFTVIDSGPREEPVNGRAFFKRFDDGRRPEDASF